MSMTDNVETVRVTVTREAGKVRSPPKDTVRSFPISAPSMDA